MILLLDIGNSALKWATWEDGIIHPGERILLAQQQIPTIAEQQWSGLKPPQRVIVASVAEESIGAALTKWVKQAWDLAAEFVVPQSAAYAVTNAYVEPQQLGVDRWAALLAVRHRISEAACIVDCGTAITVDVLADDGEHLGGLIVPGLGLMREVLEQKTRIRLAGPGQNHVALLARDTVGAVNGGTLYAAVAFIDRVMADVASALALQPIRVITGGDAQRLLPLLSGDYLHVPDLVLEGLAVIAGGEE
jgi:type III pantothenate kinase